MHQYTKASSLYLKIYLTINLIVIVILKAESAVESTPCQTPSDEELFSQFLPESVKEDMFEQHGSWIRHTKVFQRAFPRITDEDVLEYQRRISEPRLSNRDVVWVDKKYFVADFYEEVKTAPDRSSLLQNPVTYDNGDHGLISSTEAKQYGVESLKVPQLCPLQLISGDCDAVKADLITDRALVKESTIRSVLVELFKGRDKNFYKPQQQKNLVFESQMVEHIHLLLQKEAKKYGKNRIFLQNLKRLEEPKQEMKLSREVCQPLKVTLYQALPNTWLSREGLMEDVKIALLACSLIATEIIKYLKPTVSFAADTKPGDETPYSINIPIAREEKEAKRELTRLELRLQEERAQAREEVFFSEIITEPLTAAEPEEKPKMKRNKFFSWLSKLLRGRKA